MSYSRAPNVILPGVGLTQNPALDSSTPAGALAVQLDVDIATTTSLGVVQIGNNLSITPDGVLSAEACSYATRTITEDYTATLSDYYIGADLADAATVRLPLNPPNGTQLIFKLQFGAPVAIRGLIVEAQGTSTINGLTSVTLLLPYQSISLIANDNNWFII
jgi:hypothetical protein